jgi:hypothetical protein
MTLARRFARISLSSTRWLLPWIAVLFVSAALASAMNAATGQGPATSAGEQRMSLSTTTSSLANGGNFGVISNTSPASTGHASSNGCCTWD